HKGRGEGNLLDFTELPPTGDLYGGGDVIAEAEALWGSAWKMPHCQFLTGGSTQGLQTAFFAACHPGEEVLLDRASHRAVHNALALLDLHPHYLMRDGETPILPSDVENFLKTHQKVKTVCITSPTYYGVLSDIPKIAHAVHEHGGILLVDAAHGGHLPFLGANPFLGADLVVTSAHKTLPALGQSALLFSSERFGAEALRKAAAITGTSSPSYLIMASLDRARAHMEGQGKRDYEKTILSVQKLRETFPSLQGANLDPARFTLLCSDGFALQNALETQNIYPEMADKNHVVFICTCNDKQEDFDKLEVALQSPVSLPPRGPNALWAFGLNEPFLNPWCPSSQAGADEGVPRPIVALSPRAALFSPKEILPLSAAEGRISAVQIAPYPPGVPIVAPGEVISKKHLAYLARIGYNM
ncbi:MAG: aminotransferase class V-fold PLP-dependent enzyme, partial [Oscillospiraceae bacterium]